MIRISTPSFTNLLFLWILKFVSVNGHCLPLSWSSYKSRSFLTYCYPDSFTQIQLVTRFLKLPLQYIYSLGLEISHHLLYSAQFTPNLSTLSIRVSVPCLVQAELIQAAWLVLWASFHPSTQHVWCHHGCQTVVWWPGQELPVLKQRNNFFINVFLSEWNM